MNIINKYPWHDTLWQQLSDVRARLPHALLLRGRSGIGKFDFALRLGQSLLCASPLSNGDACGTCADCNWFMQGNHPDFRLLTPDQGDADADQSGEGSKKKTARKTQIVIDQVRQLGAFLELASHRATGSRVTLICPAEAMNQNSANALLKMLEEPPPGVIFILVAHQPHRLLPTIVSRCRLVDMPMPDSAIALAWLQKEGIDDAANRLSYAGGAPLLITSEERKVIEPGTISQTMLRGSRLDPFAAAGILAPYGMDVAVSALQKWIYDMLCCRFTGAVHYHIGSAGALQGLLKSVDWRQLLDFQRKLDDARKSASHPLNLELQLESLLLQYTKIFSE